MAGVRNEMRKFFIQKSYSFMKEGIIKKTDLSFPLMLNIEPTLACNLCCFMCPSHSRSLKQYQKRKVGFMKWDLFISVIDECQKEAKLLVLNMHKDGESTLHPRFPEMLAYAVKKNAAEVVHFNTNCVIPKKETIDAIIDSGVHDISMSIDAFHPETFKKIKGRDALKEVVDNVHYFIKRRNSMGMKTPFIRAKMLGTKDILGEFELFENYWKDYADEVQLQMMHDFAGALDLGGEAKNRYPCVLPFYSTAINWDGKVTLCHRDFNEVDIFGDVNTDSLKNIFTSQKYMRYRDDLLTGNVGYMPVCAKCTNWQDSPDISNTLSGLMKGAPGKI